MKLYPNIYLTNVKDITLDLLKKHNIKGLILDIDNTLIDFNKNMIAGIEEWCNNLKSNNIKMYILSNTNKIEKVKKVADKIDVPYIFFAKKPSRKGFRKIQNLLNLKPEEIAVVGDQIMTDVYGGNRAGMFTILTKPLDKKDIFITRVKRPLEKIIINRYLKQKNKGEEKNVL